jgi:hypothetical protein
MFSTNSGASFFESSFFLLQWNGIKSCTCVSSRTTSFPIRQGMMLQQQRIHSIHRNRKWSGYKPFSSLRDQKYLTVDTFRLFVYQNCKIMVKMQFHWHKKYPKSSWFLLCFWIHNTHKKTSMPWRDGQSQLASGRRPHSHWDRQLFCGTH